MSGPFKTFAEAKAANQQKICDGCHDRNRSGISKLCSRCQWALQAYGHVKGRGVRLKEMKSNVIEAKRLVGINKDHPAVRAFVNLWLAWVQLSTENPAAVPVPKYIAKMEDADPLDVLVVMVAVYFQFILNKDYRMPDLKSCYYMICKWAIFHWHRLSAKEMQKIKSVERRDCAIYLQRNIGPLLNGFVTASESEEAARQKAMAVMSTPLKFENVVEVANARDQI
jgi:hypothetical protein